MTKMVSLTDEMGIELNKIRHKYRNPTNNRPASYSYAIAMTLKKNRMLRRKLKEMEDKEKT